MRYNSLNIENIRKIIARGNEDLVSKLLLKLHPADIADVIELLDSEDKIKVLSLLDAKIASDVLVELNDPSREEILEHIHERRLGEIIDLMASDEATDIIGDLPESRAKTILNEIEPEDSREVQELLKYDEDTAGGIMQTELVAVDQTLKVKNAVEEIRKMAQEIDDLHNVYVVSSDRKLIGALPLQKLILANPEDQLQEIMEPIDIRIPVDMDQEEVAKNFKKFDVVSLPVVDSANRLVGRIMIDDIVDVIDEEASEDLYKLAGLHEDEHVLDSPRKSIKRRLPWLFINLLTAIMVASVVGIFQDTIHAFVALAVLMPVVAGLGGNAGNQTLAVIVRGLALGELVFSNAKKALIKELLVGLANGIIMGSILALLAYIWDGNYMLGIILGLALVLNLFVAAFFGTLIPLGLKWLKFDPALASSVFITAFTDCFGFFTFLGLATIFFKYLT